MSDKIQQAADKFAELVKVQLERNERIKAQKEFVDYEKLDKIIIGAVSYTHLGFLHGITIPTKAGG